MSTREKLLGKVREWILGGKRGDDCRTIALVHGDGDRSLKPVETWEIVQGEPIDFDALASAIWDQAESDSSGSEDTQIYWALAYFGDNRPGVNAYGARQKIQIDGVISFGRDDSIGSSEKMDNPRSIATVMGRMMLDHHRLTAPWANEMMRSAQRIIDSQATRIRELEEKAKQNLILQEKLIQRNHLRNLQLRKVIYWERKKEEIGSIIIPMLPSMLSAVAGKQLTAGPNGAPQNPSNDYIEAFKRFVTTVAPQEDKLQALQKVLKTGQMMPVANLVDCIRNGRPIEKQVLLAFMKLVDDAQMKQFEQILSKDEYDLFVSVHQALYNEYLHTKQQTDKAIEEALHGEETPTHEPIRENEAFEDEFEPIPM